MTPLTLFLIHFTVYRPLYSLCFRFRFGVCYDFVFVSSCLLRLMFIVALCPYVTSPFSNSKEYEA